MADESAVLIRPGKTVPRGHEAKFTLGREGKAVFHVDGSMNRTPPPKVQTVVDAAKVIFVLAMYLAFAMRRGLAESKHGMPWVGVTLFSLIVLSATFLIVTYVLYRKRPEEEPEPEEFPEETDSEDR